MGVVCSSLSHIISRLARSPKIGCWTCGGYKTNYKDEVVKFLFPPSRTHRRLVWFPDPSVTSEERLLVNNLTLAQIHGCISAVIIVREKVLYWPTRLQALRVLMDRKNLLRCHRSLVCNVQHHVEVLRMRIPCQC